MKINKLFQVLVVTGASSTVGLAACSSDSGGTGSSGGSAGATTSGAGATASGGTAGAATSGGSAGATTSGGTAGAATSGGSAGAATTCGCGPSPCGNGFIDCGGCCCWITAPSKGICAEEGCPADDTCCATQSVGAY